MYKTPGDIIFLHMCIINQDHIMYVSWGIFLSFWAIFLLFGPPNNAKNQNFEKTKKGLEILSFYTCVPQMTIIWCSDVSRPFGSLVYQFKRSNSGAQKRFFNFLFEYFF